MESALKRRSLRLGFAKRKWPALADRVLAQSERSWSCPSTSQAFQAPGVRCDNAAEARLYCAKQAAHWRQCKDRGPPFDRAASLFPRARTLIRSDRAW